jgi:hypothetical protein
MYVTKPVYTINELTNLSKYLCSKLISYAVVNYSLFIHKKPHYSFLSRLPEIDFSKPYTDKELYKEFNLTKEEIQEVEDWYKTWTKDNK